ncbi:MAG: hypothetical protein ACREQL_08225 [Candidatus Binatia bacterium]
MALASSGCVTGHLLDAGRRWEQPATFEAASLDGDRLVLRYRALVTDDDGEAIGAVQRRAAVSVDALREGMATVGAPRIELLPDQGPLDGRPLPLVAADDGVARPRIEISHPPGGGPARLALYDERGPGAPLYSNAFARSSTAGWVYPLLPVAVAVDVVGVPVLLLFAPAMLTIGD